MKEDWIRNMSCSSSIAVCSSEDFEKGIMDYWLSLRRARGCGGSWSRGPCRSNFVESRPKVPYLGTEYAPLKHKAVSARHQPGYQVWVDSKA